MVLQKLRLARSMGASTSALPVLGTGHGANLREGYRNYRGRHFICRDPSCDCQDAIYWRQRVLRRHQSFTEALECLVECRKPGGGSSPAPKVRALHAADAKQATTARIGGLQFLGHVVIIII